MECKLLIEAPVNGGRNYNGSNTSPNFRFAILNVSRTCPAADGETKGPLTNPAICWNIRVSPTTTIHRRDNVWSADNQQERSRVTTNGKSPETNTPEESHFTISFTARRSDKRSSMSFWQLLSLSF